jgi:hypothetical protein
LELKNNNLINKDNYLKYLEGSVSQEKYLLHQKSDILYKSRKSFFMNSNILDRVQGNALKNLIGTKYLWDVIYRGSTDGFLSTNFHSKCDNKGENIVVIRSSNGSIFGGYNPFGWISSNTYTNHKDSCLFTIKNISNVPPCIFKNSNPFI